MSDSPVPADWICPALGPYWQLGKQTGDATYVLQGVQGTPRYPLTAREAEVLRYFVGRFTVGQLQTVGQKKWGDTLEPEFVQQLLKKLMDWGVLETTGSLAKEHDVPALSHSSAAQPKGRLVLKAAVHWIAHPEGHWILRNPEDGTYMQLDPFAKQVVDDLTQAPAAVVAQRRGLDRLTLRSLLQQLTLTAMVEGTHPPKPAKRKFKPTDLLYFKFSLFNPDPALNRTLPYLQWLWTRPVALFLSAFITGCTVFGLNQWQAITYTGTHLWQSLGPMVLLPFGALAMVVVTLHELGHAYTLKHYGGIVPDIGVMVMFLMPAVYTNTSDQYALVKRSQRVWVVAAGVVCQLTIAGVALCLWHLSVPDSWLFKASYLLMVAALFTVALNLNPLARFDGYYLAIALSGINNLKSRSFLFYKTLLRGQRSQELPKQHWLLAIYAPFSLGYLVLVFGKLFSGVMSWILLNAPGLMACLLILWAIYYYSPSPKVQSQ